MNKINFSILGGDLRYKFLYNMLKENHNVKIFNNSFVKNNENSIDSLLENCDILIAPIPFSKDKKNIFNNSFTEISFDLLKEKLIQHNVKIIAGGVIPKEFNLYPQKIKIFDFFEQDSVAVLNAIPTAEGAIQTAMQESPKTIFGSNSIVLGYGRCGKILANTLKGIGANVAVTYRKDSDYSYIKAFGFESIKLQKLSDYINKFDFIFNTIPSCILDENLLKNVNKNSIIIDLAEAPGGVDYNFARKINLKAIYCPALPGKVAPYTAAEILKNSILNYCTENL